MRFRLRTLLFVLPMLMAVCCCAGIAFALLTDGTAPASARIDAPLRSDPVPFPPVRAGPAAIQVEWSELRFAVKEGAAFDVQQFPQAIRDLAGRQVRIRGYFHDGQLRNRDLEKFLLIGEVDFPALGVKLGPFPPDPSRWLRVSMAAGRRAQFVNGPVAVTGRLELEPVEVDGEVWCVFHIVADSVEPVPTRAGYHPAIVNGC